MKCKDKYNKNSRGSCLTNSIPFWCNKNHHEVVSVWNLGLFGSTFAAESI